jgi:7-cyano-7-deazaguanine tRNA-ribosyltransferase
MHLPPHKPLHVFGVGHPMIIPFLVALGADLFDSASYILYARDNRYMTETGTKRLDELQYLPCNCPICSKYTVKELLEMPMRERIELLATHNLYMLRKELENTKEAIKEGRLWEYLEYKSKAHPSLRRAFRKLVKYLSYIEKYNPISKGGSFALLLIDRDSLSNPRLQSIKEYVFKYITKRYSGEKIVFIPAYKKPFDLEETVLEIKDKLPDHKILLFHHYLGIFPPELSNTYPYFQHEIGIVDDELINVLVDEIKDFIRSIKPEEALFVKTGIREFDNVIDKVMGDEEFRTTYTLGVLSSSSQPRPQEPS